MGKHVAPPTIFNSNRDAIAYELAHWAENKCTHTETHGILISGAETWYCDHCGRNMNARPGKDTVPE